MAPRKYSEFRDDGFYVVGTSEAARAWPYVQPGPGDEWAGGRQHTYTVLFNLRPGPVDGVAHLVIDFVDTHGGSPPRLRATINGWTEEMRLPVGGGDESIRGDLARAKPSQWDITIPAHVLRTGDNEIELTTISGSWLLYDDIRLETDAKLELGTVSNRTEILGVHVPPVWLKDGEKSAQPITLDVRHVGAPIDSTVRIGSATLATLKLKDGLQSVALKAPTADASTNAALALIARDRVLAETNITIGPPRIRELWLLPHSHVDIGYTHRQAEVAELQIGNLKKAMELARASAGNPVGMRFKWNPEAVWTLDNFLHRATSDERAQFIRAVKAGNVGVDALYGNLLTGLCRPEELAECLAIGARMADVTGVPVQSASICDVPGYTWGIVPAMAQAGIKYFAIGPNFGDRVGTIHLWDNKPFYWKSQSSRERVLCWVVDNYHFYGDVEHNVLTQVERLQRGGFPYDLSFLFWVGQWPNGGVDNAPPDGKLAEKVVAWNAKYALPKVVIGLVPEFFREFERREGARVPQASGDLTPYWEDGAGSTSAETALNRATDERLSQATALFAMRHPHDYPAARFTAAWKNALLYTEHTWGAWCSISKPDDSFTVDQWKGKQRYALAADQESRDLLKAALPPGESAATALDVFNTTQWKRTDLATVPPGMLPANVAGIADERGEVVPSQRLTTGELVFLARDVPPFGAKRFRLQTEHVAFESKARVDGNLMDTSSLHLEVDPVSGAIEVLRIKGVDHDFVRRSGGIGLNDFRYLAGTNALAAKRNEPVELFVSERGPLVAELRIESDAPGCNRLTRRVRVVDGLDRVELTDDVDRKSVREKDGVHFGFGFDVPSATIRLESPWAVVRPNSDQMMGACRNWFTVQRWLDVSGPDYGITLAPLDAPLIEIGGLTANLIGSVNFNEWMTNSLDSTTIYSWAQNNHWHTNYKIDQPGVTRFRYVVRPHRRGYSGAESARFGLETTRPLLVTPAEKGATAGSLVRSSSDDVLIETVKVSEDGRALVLRLFGVSGRDESVALKWGSVKPSSVWLSDLPEKPVRELRGRIDVPAYGLVNVRAELK